MPSGPHKERPQTIQAEISPYLVGRDITIFASLPAMHSSLPKVELPLVSTEHQFDSFYKTGAAEDFEPLMMASPV